MVPGTQVGAYRLISQIGAGGMGAVWLAEHAMLGRRAAIKLLHPMYSARQDIVTRFFNEARAATSISDPGIVQIFDFGQHVDGTAYIAMEMLEGEPLDRRLSRLGRLGINDAMRIMRQVASTLGAVHERGIVHRDLKPENIYLVRDPEVAGGERAKVLDFGIAKLGGDVQSKTATSAVMGTPTYMSPEQCRGAGRVDQRADVYSMGCMLYALITGAPPFDSNEGAGEVIAMHLREQPVPPSHRAPGISPRHDALILRCLAKLPDQRFASGTQLAAAISEMFGYGSTAPPVDTRPPQPSLLVPSPSHAVTTMSSSSGVTMPVAGGNKRWMYAAIGGLAVGGLVIAGVVAGRGPAATSVGTAPNAAPAAAPSPPPPPPKPDPRAALTAQIRTMFERLPTWAKAHAGEACPTAAELGAGNDPWGHALTVTCTEQPRNQVLGAISAGPDGIAGNGDDVYSWELGGDVTAAVRGKPWETRSAVVPEPAARPPVVPVAKVPEPPVARPIDKIIDRVPDKMPDKPKPKPRPKPTVDDSDIPGSR